jgi:hypothetical protein
MSRTTGAFSPVVGQRPNEPTTTFAGFLQPETVAATISSTPNSSAPVGSNHQLVQFNMSKARNEIGYRLPVATCIWVTVPTGTQYSVGGRFNLPLLNTSTQAQAELNLNVAGAVSIAGGTATIVGIQGEDIN